MKDDPIAKVLDGLISFDDILACMVACRNMVSVEPSGGTDCFKPEIREIWDDVKFTMDYAFEMISHHSGFRDMIYRVRDYEVILYVLPDTGNALVVIIHKLANKGFIEVELERARQEIQKIRKEEENKKIQG